MANVLPINLMLSLLFMISSSTASEIITIDGIEQKLEESVEITENLDENLITSGVAISMLFSIFSIQHSYGNISRYLLR